MAMDGGDTFLVDRPGTSYDSHLWIVLSKPSLDPNHVLIVNLTSWRPDKDQACVLRPGDHRYVKKQTCVNYADSKIVSEEQIRQLLDRGLLLAHEPVDPTLLERMREAAVESRFMPLDHAEILFEQGLVAES